MSKLYGTIDHHLLATVAALALYGFTGAVFAVLSKDPILVVSLKHCLSDD